MNEEQNTDDERPSSTKLFVRILIVALCLGLSALVYMSFAFSSPPYVISTGIVTLVSLIVVLVLSESFNQLSVGALLTLKREVAKEQAEKDAVKSENQELRSELVRVVTTVSQTQTNNTLLGTPEFLRALGVVPAAETGEDHEPPAIEPACPEPAAAAERARRERWSKIRAGERVAMRKYLAGLELPGSEVQTEVEFSSGFAGLDPIMDRRIVFRAYARAVGHERFFDFRPSTTISPMFFDQLYVKLSKVHLYGMAKRIRADLVLVFVRLPEELESAKPYPWERVLEWFEPAMVNRLLKIEHIEVTREEIEAEMAVG